MTDTTPGCGSNSEARKRLAEKASTPDDREVLAIRSLAAELRELWHGRYVGDGHNPLTTDGDEARTVAGDVLTSEWLAEHDAQVRAETAEQIAREFTRRADPSSEGVWRDACNLLAEIARQSSEGGGERG